MKAAAVDYTRRFLALVIAAAERAGYLGNWVLAFGATGLQGLDAASGSRDVSPEIHYDEETHTQAISATWVEIADTPALSRAASSDDSPERWTPKTGTKPS